MAKEWSTMSIRYKALRVTNPQGQQSSTYFLQLPYRYSVPLLIISALLHWVLSGCIYLLVMKGGYFDTYGSDGPFSSVMAVGHSMKSLFTMMILAIFLAFIPPVFGRISLPPNTVVPRPEKPYHESTAVPEDDEIELRRLMAPSSSVLTRDDQASESRNDEEVWKDTLLRVSQSKIRWGVVKMPSSWEEQFNRRDIAVEHISFGLPEDDVQQPVVGHWYA
ncbi:hypothetical protein INS49_004551 [Diaporthe citri]|uniref:uncharacterized protein n=1 Tax=Diaporthe citri TaxID=83186 RepID=UPI001C81AE78|nr:uncharacterized protein INS49_004551 [Diaporthe citri]KAG6354534.1 hypothetical protein INS49_004551 [Diaporthe citri]